MSKRQLNPDNLAAQLDTYIPPGHTSLPSQPPVDDPLIETALRLSNASHPQLSVQTMERIQQEMLAAQSAQQRRFFRPTSVMLVAACMILALLFVNPLIAESLPGDTLYPAKRAIERVELSVTGLVQNDVPTRLKHAARRADEAFILVAAGQFDMELIDEALQQVSQVVEAVEPDGIQAIQDQVQQINSQLEYVVVTAQAENLAAESTLVELAARMQTLRVNNPVLFAVPQPPVMLPDETPTATVTATWTATATMTASFTAAPTNTIVSSPTWTPKPVSTITPVPDVSITVLPQPTQAFVLGNGRVNVRQGPGLNFPIVAQVSPGDALTIIGQNDAGDWFHIRLVSNVEGWITSTLIYIGDEPPVIPPTPSGSSNSDPGNENNRPDCPGNSCNAPGQTGEQPTPPGPPDCPGNSCNAPGQTGEQPTPVGPPDCPGNSCNAPGNPNAPDGRGNQP